MALILPGQTPTGNGMTLPKSGGNLVLPGSKDAEKTFERNVKTKQYGLEARAANLEAEQAMTSAKFLNVIKDVTKGIAQSTARSFLVGGQALADLPAEIKEFATGKPGGARREFVPTTGFEKALIGTDKPVSFKSMGEEFAPLLKHIGVSEDTTKKLAVPIGFFAGALDLVPGFQGGKKGLEEALLLLSKNIAKTADETLIRTALKTVVKGDAKAMDALTKTLKNVDNADDVRKLVDLSLKEGKVSVNAAKIKIPKKTLPTELPPELKDVAERIVKNNISKESYIKNITDVLKSGDIERAAKVRAFINKLDETGISVEKFHDLVTTTGGGGNLDALGRKILGVEPPRRIMKTEMSLLKERISNISRGVRTGARDTRREIADLQDQVIQLAKDNLPVNLRGSLLNKLKNANNAERLNKSVDFIFKKIDEYEALKAEAKVLSSKASKISFLKKIGEFNQTTIKDAKRKLGIDVPIRRMNSAQRDLMIEEMRKRLDYKRAEGLMSKTVKPGATTAPEGFYTEFTTQKPGLVSKGINEAKDTFASIKEGAEDLLGAVSTRLANIAPELKYALRKFEFKSRKATIKDLDVARPFAKKVSNLPPEVYKELDIAMKNGFIDDVNRIAKTHGFEKELSDLRNMLDDIYARTKDVGLEVDYRKNFFPRAFKQDRQSAKAILEYFDRVDKDGVIQKAFAEKATTLGRSLSDVEKINTINTLLRGFRQEGITLSKTGGLKSRVIDLVTPELDEFYDDSITTIFRYIESVDNLIESRRFFGKHLDLAKLAPDGDMKDVVGAYVNNLISSGKISSLDQMELERILKARFSGKQANLWIGALKNIGYLSVMGSPLNALTQINDLALAFYRAGAKNAVGGLADALRNITGVKSLTRESVGIGHIAEEFADKNLLARSVDRVFKLTGLEQIDRLGKETFINGTFRALQKQAVDDVEKLASKLDPIFGKEAASVIEDLKNGITSENVKYLLFNELADFQPIALSEVPLKYLEAPNGRIFYALKTYTIKQWDIYRREIFQQFKTDPLQATKNLMRFAGYLAVFQATADEIKDFITGRETSFSDRIINSVVKVAGFNRYNLNQVTSEGIGRTLFQQILPPTQLADDLSKDMINVFTDPEKAAEISKLKTIRDIPVGGNLFYWWFGAGAEKEKKSKTSGIPSVNIPTIKIPEINIPSL